MRSAILQPTYLPWIGYFEMIDRSDAFVSFDHVQFAHKSWHCRNRIKGANGEIMLTVPVVSDGQQDVSIREKRIDYRQPWRAKHLKSIATSYRRTKYFDQYYAPLEKALQQEYGNVGDLNLALIRLLLDALGIRVRIIRSSDVELGDESALDKTERIVNLCRRLGIAELNDGASAESFIDQGKFAAANVKINFQRYVHPNYPQLFGPFRPYMSVVDLLMNCGDESLALLRTNRQG